MAKTPKTKCPAANLIHGIRDDVPALGCRCYIEGHTILVAESTFTRNCTDQYAECPTWIAYKKKLWANRYRDRETDVANMRAARIEETYGKPDDAADAVIAGEAPIESMLE